MSLHRFIGLTGLCLVVTLASATQQPSAQEKTPSSPAVSSEFVKKRFGSEFTLMPSFPPLTADLDGDGIEDVVIAARCKNPLMDQAEHSYKVLDPYDSFYGFGDPKSQRSLALRIPSIAAWFCLSLTGP